MVNYEGIFVVPEDMEKLFSKEGTFLGFRNDIPHITFLYKPDKYHLIEDYVGKDVTIHVIGYGCDGENSAFEVTFPEEYNEFYFNKDEDGNSIKPHITLSLSDNAKASNSKNLTFVKFKEPIAIQGRFGYWIKDDKEEYPLYDKLLPKLKKQSE